MSPLSNAYIRPRALNTVEKFYPLHVFVCESCFLVQLNSFESPKDIFSDYAYFSSYSTTWLAHAEAYVETITNRFALDKNSKVVEIASNDGYLLQFFKKRGIPILGVEPAANVAKIAEGKGIPTVVRFFGTETALDLAKKDGKADLLLGNNVLAHVPNLNDFVAGLKILLAPHGIITMEFPHLLRLMTENQFDTIYHEHFSYFSLLTVEKIFASHGLTLFDVEELSTHGGSLRIFARHTKDATKPVTSHLGSLRETEKNAGLQDIATYCTFAERAIETKRRLLAFLIEAKNSRKTIVAYGAPAKGNTLLNYCGIRGDFIDYTVDQNPHKQGHFLPGTRIPILHPDRIKETKPDYLLILPWNLKNEIMAQMAYVREWGCRFLVPIPRAEILQ